jgi:trans-aconitate 2-methyltransferase
MSWSATQYSTFEDERTRPVRDLLAALPLRSVRNAVDLGCGPGNSTAVLAERFPGALVTGLDSSSDMVASARRRLPDLAFTEADIGSWNPAETYDLILANASLHWVPDHAGLYPRLMSRLNTGGILAVQTPDNLDEPAHRIMREVAADGPWSDSLSAISLPPRHSARWYHEMLRPLSARLDLWRTTYFHPLAGGAAAVVEWFKGSALRPYLDPLDESERTAFLARYQARIAEAYPELSDGSVLLPFPRLFVVAER